MSQAALMLPTPPIAPPTASSTIPLIDDNVEALIKEAIHTDGRKNGKLI